MVYQYIIDRMIEDEIKAFKYNSINPNRIVMNSEVFIHMQKWEYFNKYYQEPDKITSHWPTYKGLQLLIVPSASTNVDVFCMLSSFIRKTKAKQLKSRIDLESL